MFSKEKSSLLKAPPHYQRDKISLYWRQLFLNRQKVIGLQQRTYEDRSRLADIVTIFVLGKAERRDTAWEQGIICNRTRNLGRRCPPPLAKGPAVEKLPRGRSAAGENAGTSIDVFWSHQQYYLIMHFSRSQKSKLLFWIASDKEPLWPRMDFF